MYPETNGFYLFLAYITTGLFTGLVAAFFTRWKCNNPRINPEDHYILSAMGTVFFWPVLWVVWAVMMVIWVLQVIVWVLLQCLIRFLPSSERTAMKLNFGVEDDFKQAQLKKWEEERHRGVCPSSPPKETHLV